MTLTFNYDVIFNHNEVPLYVKFSFHFVACFSFTESRPAERAKRFLIILQFVWFVELLCVSSQTVAQAVMESTSVLRYDDVCGVHEL